MAVLLDSHLSNYSSGASAFLCDLVFPLCGGEIRWRLEDQKSWMGNISCLRSGNELDIHQPSSNRIFPLLSVCTACIEMKMRMSEEGGGWKFVWSPVMKIYAEQCWWCGGERRQIWHYIKSTLYLTLLYLTLYQRWIWHYFYLKKIYLSRNNVGSHVLLKIFARCA